jgi:hypothetical protein
VNFQQNVLANKCNVGVFAIVINFNPSLYFGAWLTAYQSGALIGLHSNSRLLTLPTNIMLGWKWWTLATITTVKSFYSSCPSHCLLAFSLNVLLFHWNEKMVDGPNGVPGTKTFVTALITTIRAQCYKTFDGHKLGMFVIS